MNHLECVGKGWHPIVQPLIEQAEREGVKIAQVKEKFGGLRFYVYDASSDLYEKIEAAEKKSQTTCEDCGAPGEIVNATGYWFKCLCPSCLEERRKK